MEINEAFNIETATRDKILTKSLRKPLASNRMVRQALGWREISASNFSIPRFQSKYIKELYDKIDWLAKHNLPVHDLEGLYDSWMHDSPIRDEIELLFVEYGEKIWDEPMHKRDLASNPASHLLVANENEIYSTDLFSEFEHHRK